MAVRRKKYAAVTKKEFRARTGGRDERMRRGRGGRRGGRQGCRRSRKSTDPADSAGHNDEGAGGESRAVGIKSSPNIGVLDRRGRELINCRNGGHGGAREGKEGRDRKAVEEAGNRRVNAEVSQ